MNNKFKLFFQCVNERELIEAKLEWALRLDMEVSVVEGHHPHYKKVNEKGLSVDGTTEILESYSDRITYFPIGSVTHQAFLREAAYRELLREEGIALMLDVDEFYLEKDLEEIDFMFSANENLKLVLTNSYIFLDGEYCAPHIQRKQGDPIKFDKNLEIYHGQFHERVFRYDPFYGYDVTPFLVNDLLGRHLFNDPAYYGERKLRDDIFLLHYKNFKLSEAKERHEAYKNRGDKEDYDSEWKTLEESKFKYEGKHPIEIKRLLK